ncbi:uncharacterized protein LOC119575870 [Penaeus monodon]|uniref:uncharacterized protein LOC119575870 n=1 Tax=Penaeus monodon TaxID=6687 RepID=UPI0018A75A31|nr:uncharacterized protein LOC119575870 [Penaeus monodon]
MAFIGLSKGFDTVNRKMLWWILEKIGVPAKFLTILRQFHDGMQSQSCSTQATLYFFQIHLQTSLSLFNAYCRPTDQSQPPQRLLQTYRPVSASSTPTLDLQTSLSLLNTAYEAMGLKVNIGKTEIIQGQNETYQPVYIHKNIEINVRISKTSVAFGRPGQPVFNNHNLKATTKAEV